MNGKIIYELQRSEQNNVFFIFGLRANKKKKDSKTHKTWTDEFNSIFFIC